MTADADVGVVGAGIAGLATASFLAAKGINVELLESATSPRVTGAGVMLHPNGLHAAAGQGLPLNEVGMVITEQVTMDRDGSVTVVDWASVWPDELPVAVHRRALAQILLDSVPRAAVHWAHTVDNVLQNSDGVEVRLDNGVSRRYRMLVGADGIHSRVRAGCQIPSEIQSLGTTYWRVTAAADGFNAASKWRVWRSGPLFFGVTPIGDGRLHVFFQAPDHFAQNLQHFDAESQMVQLSELMGTAVSNVYAGLALSGDVYVSRTAMAHSASWSVGRVVLAGDAVHAVAPATTQGAALAIEDAAVLAQEVSRLGPGEAAVDAFVLRRAGRIDAFRRRARLHAALLPALHAGGESMGQREGKDAARWFRQLYEPLMTRP